MENQGLYYSVHGQNFQEGSIIAIDMNKIDGRCVNPLNVLGHQAMRAQLNIDKVLWEKDPDNKNSIPFKMTFSGVSETQLKVNAKPTAAKFINFGKISGNLFLFWKDYTILIVGPGTNEDGSSDDALVDNTFNPFGPFHEKFYKKWKEDNKFRDTILKIHEGKSLFLISRALHGAIYTASSSSINSNGEIFLGNGQIQASADGGIEIETSKTNGSLTKKVPIAFQLIQLLPDGSYKPFP
ncbi:MAG: hypothetical protein MH321_06035 [Leptospiraceae bacterium]|nr:hypothetical protein [Leptospiraceae bacterium]